MRSMAIVMINEHAQCVRTPFRAPQANGVAERFVRTARSECLDWLLVLNAEHLAHGTEFLHPSPSSWTQTSNPPANSRARRIVDIARPRNMVMPDRSADRLVRSEMRCPSSVFAGDQRS